MLKVKSRMITWARHVMYVGKIYRKFWFENLGVRDTMGDQE
jgi:hypothetical protein